jgi:hypothetical protein
VSNVLLENISDLCAEPLASVLGAELQAPLIDGSTVRYVNLDYAASTPALQQVNDYLQSVLPYYASVHRGAGYASQISTSLYENARKTVRTFVGGRADDAVIFTRNTTDSLNLLAGCVPADGEVLYLDLEHHANLLPWLARPHRGIVAADTIEATLAAVEDEARFCQSTGLQQPPMRTERGSSSTQLSWPRTGGWISCVTASTTWLSPDTSCTRRSAPASWSVGPTGSTPARPTLPVVGL